MTRELPAILTVLLLLFPASAQDWRPRGERPPKAATTSVPAQIREMGELSVIQGEPTDHSVTLNVLSAKAREAYVEYGLGSGDHKSKTAKLPAGKGGEKKAGDKRRDI